MRPESLESVARVPLLALSRIRTVAPSESCNEDEVTQSMESFQGIQISAKITGSSHQPL